MPEVEVINKVVPTLAPLVGMIILLVMLKKYLLVDTVPMSLMDRVVVQEQLFSKQLVQLDEQTKQVKADMLALQTIMSDQRKDLDELLHLSFEHQTATKELFAGLKKRQDDYVTFVSQRKDDS